MKKIILIILPLILFTGIIFSEEDNKRGGLFSRKSSESSEKKDIILVKDPYTMDDLNKIRSDFNSQKSGSLELLIEIYKDKNQILEVRLESLNILSTSKNPSIKSAILETISDSEFLEMEIMKKALKI